MAAQGADPLLASIAELGRRIFGAAACSLALLEDDDEHLVFRAASGAGAGEVVGMRLPVSKGIAGWVVSSGQPIAVHDVRADPRFAVDVAESTGYVPRSILAAPLTAHGEALGVVEVLDRAPADARGDDMDLLGLLAAQAALAVELVSRPAPAQQSPEDLTVAVQALRQLGTEEQRTALALVGEFLAYARRRGGSTGVE